ncbi:CynX/NimT family MFS transporter [Brucella pituitosa]|uniref:MFS transporter n=1 Tax=Brucella pituitosa TaxID=571256 RepID=UPI003C77AC3A
MPAMQHSQSHPPREAGWTTVFIIAGAGVVSAFQVGKAPMALGAIQLDLGLSLVVVSWLISAFAIIGAIVGAPVGLAVDRIGTKRMVVGGLALQAVGAGLGGVSPGIELLMISRVVEGLGFLAVLVAGPAMIFATVPPRIQDRAIAVWATVMPVGMTTVMLAAPLLTLLEWRGFWLLNAAILFAYAVFFVFAVPAPKATVADDQRIGTQLRQALVTPGPWALATIFAAFSAAFFVMFSFLPSLLTERFGLGQELASTVSAIAIAASGVGNLAAGFLLASGRKPLHLLAAGFLVMTVFGFGVLAADFSWIAIAIFAVLFAFMAGLIPVVLMDSVPRFAPRPELVGATLGLAMQGNNVGMLVGPAAGGALAASFGWTSVAIAMAVVSIAAVVVARSAFTARAKPGRQPTEEGVLP